MKKKTMYFAALTVAAMVTFSFVLAQPRPKVDIRKAKVSQSAVDSIKTILAGASPETYNFDYSVNGKSVQRLGSASFRQISTVKGYSQLGSRGGKYANEILTTVDNYVKTIWTSKFSQLYPEKVRQINQILERSAAMR